MLRIAALKDWGQAMAHWYYGENEGGPGANGPAAAEELGVATATILHLLLGRPATVDEMLVVLPHGVADIAADRT